ncbi:hypothetical protein ABNX05_11130 [Lysinibacillus sp. M3]|uniref:Uncharacterized protein n=1 Tax=Lysinibacillus zambalensis TaxID=3160866 RepID=A0ABV1MRP5_9BACI
MYIVKLSQIKSKSDFSIPNLLDGFHEVDTIEEALEIRKSWISKYPNLVNVNIFKSEEVIIEDDIREVSLREQKECLDIVMKLRELGIDSYKVIDFINNKTTVYKAW